MGPLPMYPAAEDNYGYDACAVLCLPCVPNILVIATESGMLYHCVVLEAEDEEDGGVRIIQSIHLTNHQLVQCERCWAAVFLCSGCREMVQRLRHCAFALCVWVCGAGTDAQTGCWGGGGDYGVRFYLSNQITPRSGGHARTHHTHRGYIIIKILVLHRNDT